MFLRLHGHSVLANEEIVCYVNLFFDIEAVLHRDYNSRGIEIQNTLQKSIYF